jgi:hypothetical protein
MMTSTTALGATLKIKLGRLENRGPGGRLLACWSALGERHFVGYEGRTRRVPVAARVVREADGWRADFCEATYAGAWLPWEPISSATFATKAEAVAALRAWANPNRAPMRTRRASSPAAAAAEAVGQ